MKHTSTTKKTALKETKEKKRVSRIKMNTKSIWHSINKCNNNKKKQQKNPFDVETAISIFYV